MHVVASCPAGDDPDGVIRNAKARVVEHGVHAMLNNREAAFGTMRTRSWKEIRPWRG